MPLEIGCSSRSPIIAFQKIPLTAQKFYHDKQELFKFLTSQLFATTWECVSKLQLSRKQKYWCTEEQSVSSGPRRFLIIYNSRWLKRELILRVRGVKSPWLNIERSCVLTLLTSDHKLIISQKRRSFLSASS